MIKLIYIISFSVKLIFEKAVDNSKKIHKKNSENKICRKKIFYFIKDI